MQNAYMSRDPSVCACGHRHSARANARAPRRYVITDAHPEGVSALCVTHDNSRLVTGGKDGRVRVWNVGGTTQVGRRARAVFVCVCVCVCVCVEGDTYICSAVRLIAFSLVKLS